MSWFRSSEKDRAVGAKALSTVKIEADASSALVIGW